MTRIATWFSDRGASSLADGRLQALLIAIGIGVLLLPLLVRSSTIYVLSLVFIYGILAFSAIIPIGYGGQLVLSQGAFFGIGAYTYVKLVGTTPTPSWIAVVVGTLLTAVVAYVLGLPAIRAGGIYLGIITLAFNEMFVLSLDLFQEFFGGSQGLPSPDLLFPAGLTALVPIDALYYYLAAVAFVGCLYSVIRLLNSEIGWAFLAIREDLTTAESLGIDTRKYRLLSFSLSGVFCGFAGTLFAPITGYISPTMFNLQTTIDIILAGVAGGISLPAGSILGALIVVYVPENLRFLADIRFLVYGIFLVLLLIYVPEGIGGWVKERFDEKE